MSKIKIVIDLLKTAGIDASKYIGKVDPSKVKQLIPKNQKTATKPKLIDALNKDKATFSDALNVFENDAKYLSQMNEMELTNFANNLHDYFTVGGKVKWKPSNVVTTEGTPVVGKKLETLAARKGAAGEADTTSLQGAMEGLASLIDEMKGISPKMRNKMDRDELVAFIRKMRGRDFTNQEIKLIRDYMDEWGIGLAKEKAAPAMAHAKKLGAKDKEEFQFIEEYLDNVQTTSPEKFREMFDVKKINMDINTSIENKLEKHFKKKFKWDNTKKDGGLDDATFTKYEDELYEAQTEFMDFHRVYDTDIQPGSFGFRKSTGWANHPKNYLDEASEKLKSITGEGLNTNFWKNYTDEVLTKYPKPEKFEYGGIAGMLGERTGYESGRRAMTSAQSTKRKASPTDWYTDKIIADNLGRIKSDMFLKYILPERNLRWFENITDEDMYGTYDEDSGYSGIVKGDFITKDGKRIEFPAPADKGIDVHGLLELLDNPGGVSKDYNVEDMKPFDKRFYWDDDKGFVRGVELKGGGIAGMLGEPTYQDEDHRVPYGGGGVGLPPVSFYFDMQGGAGKEQKNFLGVEGLTQKGYDYGGKLAADTTFPFLSGELSVGGELGFGRYKSNVDYKGQPIDWLSNVGETKLGDDWNVGLKWSKKFNEGGRVPLVFGGRTIGVLKNLLTKMKKSQKIPRGEKTLKPDAFAKSIMSEEDKLKLLKFETQYANSVLEHLKADRQLFKQLETNKEMKDQGLDFLMKHFVDTQAPHMKNYKSLADIDQAILELETLVKNKTLKEGRQLNASGGRVGLSGGGLTAALKFLMQKYGKDVIKFAKDVKPSKKWDTQKAIREFKKRNPQFKAKGGVAGMLGE